MGLLDIINGMQKGPRGQPDSGGRSGGLSPVSMALMGLLAYKAVKSFAGSKPGQATAESGSGGGATGGGGIGEIVGRLFGGGQSGGEAAGTPAQGGAAGALSSLFGGAGGGAVVSSGLGNLLQQFQDRGYGRAAQSWVGGGPNEPIAPDDVEHALGGDTLEALIQKTGMSRADLLASLSQHLPELVNQLTPHGRVPTEEEASRMV